MRCKNLFAFVFAVFLIGAASASFTVSENGSLIKVQYETGDYIKADLNISFFNESLNSNFSDSLGNSISLKNLLALSSDYHYIFYDLTNKTISSAFQTLKLEEAGFDIPSTTGNRTYHLYLNEQSIFDGEISVISSSDSIEKELKDKYALLNSSKFKIAKYDAFVQESLNEFLNITSIENSLENLKQRYLNADTSEEYAEILNNISAIRIPSSINELVTTGSISFYPDREKINLNVLAEIGGGDYGENVDGYLDAIYAWNNDNLKSSITFSEIVLNYESGEPVILRIFQFVFDKSKLNENAYFIVENLENIKFMELLPSQIGESSYGYSYVKLNDIGNTLTFSTTQEINFMDIPAFISPSLNDLTLPIVGPFGKWISNERSKWIFFTIVITIILLIFITIYALIQIWYRKRYETHLFKNRNNMFNIMTYINTAKRKGMTKEEIIKNLKKAGWTGEQINYALRKYEGKKIVGIIKEPLNIGAETENKGEKKPHKDINKPGNTKV